MRHVKRFLAGISVIVLLGCAAARSEEQTTLTQNFMSAKDILGKNETQMVETLGQPASKTENGCKVPVPSSGEVGEMYGQAWSYAAEVPGSSVSLKVCLIKGVSVAYRQEGFAQTPEGVIYSFQRDALHLGLIGSLLGGGDKQTFMPPQRPFAKGKILI